MTIEDILKDVCPEEAKTRELGIDVPPPFCLLVNSMVLLVIQYCSILLVKREKGGGVKQISQPWLKLRKTGHTVLSFLWGLLEISLWKGWRSYFSCLVSLQLSTPPTKSGEGDF